ncbi:hypothetical protein [Streptomyces sp. NPDC050988]|uniref:hypothetical protein n=1 Tax=Streptomyces sp. NPDC050988 TaxID=3365637 RepID=UPI0037AC2472
MDTVLRANPGYQLVLLDRLSPSGQSRFRAGYDGDDLYGALMPVNGSRLEPRAVSSETALLLLTLAAPGPLPRFVGERLGADTERTVQRLVLDEVLQVLCDGEFVSGSGAVAIPARAAGDGGRARTQELAVAALKYGQRLSGLSAEDLGRRLYSYGRQPISPQLRRRFGSTLAIGEHLGLAPGGRVRSMLPDGWSEMASPVGARRDVHWWQWGYRPALTRTQRGGGHKLYVSPALDGLSEALEQVVSVVVTVPSVRGFKVGAGIEGICRPDKIVVYVEGLDGIGAVTDRLGPVLSGCQAHGVPFTAAVSQDGLLSWGIDPPRRKSITVRAVSWRMWLTQRLARHITEYVPSDKLEAWQFAIERLGLSGVDTRTWSPVGGLWLGSVDED